MKMLLNFQKETEKGDFMKIIATNKETGKSFTAFGGSEAECEEKMICLKLDEAMKPKDALENKYTYDLQD